MSRSSTHTGQPRSIAAIETLEDRRLLSTVVAVSGRDVLLFFDTSAPEQTLAKVKVRGMERKESLLGIDYRPVNQQLYGLGSTGQLYQINANTGTAVAIGTPAVTLPDGEDVGFDFNPSVDRIRVVTDGGQNLRLNPDDGSQVDYDLILTDLQSDVTPAFVVGDPNAASTTSLVDVAYTNNVSAGTPTTLYGIDGATASLVRVGSIDGTPDSPNDGGVTTVGALNIVDIEDAAGLDIETVDGVDTAYAALATAPKSRSNLFTVDLTTGATTLIGAIRGSRRPVADIAIVPTGNTILALDKKGRLSVFDTNLPGVAAQVSRINGLARKEKIVAIDGRPANSVIYGFSNQSRLYSIDPLSGLATAVGGQTAFTLDRKGVVDMDFNPLADAVRVVNSRGENIRINVTTGQIVDTDEVLDGVQVDGPLVYASTDANALSNPNVTGIAYSNSSFNDPTTATTLYAIDTKQDVLTTIGTVDGTTSPNTGQMNTVGSLGFDAKDPATFDITSDSSSNIGYAAFNAKGEKFSLYTVDLLTGGATMIGRLGKGITPISITVLPGVTPN